MEFVTILVFVVGTTFAMLFKPPAYKIKDPPIWATYIQDRSPQFKIHNKLEQANAALNYGYSSNRRGGVLYELVDNEWVQRKRVKGRGLKDAAEPGICAGCEQSSFSVGETDYLCAKCRALNP